MWRARWLDWTRAKGHRLREVGRQVAGLTADLRQAHLDHDLPSQSPLLGHALAHQLLSKWSADVVAALLFGSA